MSIIFNPLLLSNKMDRHPRSWICIKGEPIKEIVWELEEEIVAEKKITREEISRIISKSLFCNHVSMKNLLRGKRKFYPIPFILELCNLSRRSNFYENKIKQSIEELKVNSASAKPIKAIKRLSRNIAKIIGAFCADGSLSLQFVIANKNKEELRNIKKIFQEILSIKKSESRNQYYVTVQANKDNIKKLTKFSEKNKNLQIQTHYNIDLTEEHKSNVESFNKWICEEFRIKPTSFYKKDNAWRTIFSNKILARYLICFFNINPGYKTYTIDEPEIIKKSPLRIRKEFAKGVLMFDGCINKRLKISFSSKSQYLAGSIKDILKKDELEIGFLKNKRGEHIVYTTSKNSPRKLMSYFEKNTKKWDLINWLCKKDFNSKNINKKDKSTSNNILEYLKQIRSCDAKILMDQFSYSHTTIREKLRILKLKGLIRLSNKPKIISKYISEETLVFLKKEFNSLIFNRIHKNFKSFEKFASFISVPKGTLSAWKVRKNRIPLKILQDLCNYSGVSYKKAIQNIKETDREIVEII